MTALEVWVGTDIFDTQQSMAWDRWGSEFVYIASDSLRHAFPTYLYLSWHDRRLYSEMWV